MGDDGPARGDTRTVTVTPGPDAPAAAARATPDKIGRYTVLHALGEGGMGAVYAAHDERLDRQVAVKVVLRGRSEVGGSRMLREAQAMARLSHPNVAAIYEVGRHEGGLFIAMEYIEGDTLRDWQTQQDRPWREILDAYLQAGRGLAAAHAEGLVHRDFKPHNVMIDPDGRVRVLDFGLAARPAETSVEERTPVLSSGPVADSFDARLTETGVVMGTPAYMAPEQIAGGPVDHRSDQFAFCVAMWEALHGTRPERASDLFGPAGRGSTDRRETGAAKEVPRAIEEALERGLAAEPDERWPDLGALLHRLERAGAAPRRARRRRRLVAGIAVAGAMVGFGVPAWQSQVERRATRACEREALEARQRIHPDDVAEKVRAALGRFEREYAALAAETVPPRLDAYAAGWAEVHREACIEHGVARRLTANQHAKAMWCLERQGGRLLATVEQLLAAKDLTVRRSASSVARLPDPSRCIDPTRLARLPDPPSPEQRTLALELQRLLSRSAALRAVGSNEEGLSLAEEVERRSVEAGLDTEHRSALVAIGEARLALGRAPEAEAALTDAYFTASKADDAFLQLRASLALTYVIGNRLRRPDEGKQWARHAEAALDALGVDQDSSERADYWQVLGGVLAAAGEHEDARAARQRALEIHLSQKGPDHPHVAAARSDLASSLQDLGDRAGAVAEYERALAIEEAVLGSDHPQVGSTLFNLAGALDTTEKRRSLALQERALPILEGARGRDHVDVAIARIGLAQTLERLGEPAPAERMARTAAEIFAAQLGQEHPLHATALGVLGRAQHAQGDTEAARATWERARLILSGREGQEYPLAIVLEHLAGLDAGAGEPGRAAETYAAAVTAMETARGPRSAKLVSILHPLGAAYCGAGNGPAARAAHERALDIQTAQAGPDAPEVADGLARYALTLHRLQDPRAAREHLDRALAIADQPGARASRPAVLGRHLAEAIVAIDDDRERARKRALEASKACPSASPADPEGCAELREWLHQHEPGAAPAP